MTYQSFQIEQIKFAQHIRDPENVAPPSDIEPRRMAVYRELFYNNIEGFIRRGFPVLRSIMIDECWHAMVRDFIANYRAQTPYFLEIGKVFVDYLQTHRGVREGDPAFLIELAHYEWVDLALDIEEEQIPLEGFDPDGDVLKNKLFLSPLICVLSYQFPVHQICREFQPAEATGQKAFLIVYRDAGDKVRFMEVNALSARLLSLLQDDVELTGQQALQQIAQELQQLDVQQVVQGGLSILQLFKDRGILLGTRL